MDTQDVSKDISDIHHRLAKSWTSDRRGGYPIEIKQKFHKAWHFLFENFDIFTVAKIINRVFGDPRYKLIVVRRKENETDRQRDWRENKKYYRRYIPRPISKDTQ